MTIDEARERWSELTLVARTEAKRLLHDFPAEPKAQNVISAVDVFCKGRPPADRDSLVLKRKMLELIIKNVNELRREWRKR